MIRKRLGDLLDQDGDVAQSKGLLHSLPHNTISGIVLLCVVLALVSVQLFRTWWRLKHVPGPFLAKFTNFQRMSWIWTKRAELSHQQMHEKYGELVRMGPNMVSFSNPEAIPTVHPMRPGFPKGQFYVTMRPYTRGSGALHLVFNTTEEQLHKQMKTPIAPLYSISSTAAVEGLVDDVLKCLSENFDRRFVKNAEIFDLGKWLQYFAFDVMGTMTFSKRYGFLDEGKDVRGMLGAIIDFMRNVAPMTQAPWLDKLIWKNRIADDLRTFFGQTASLSILGFVGNAIKERREQLASGAVKEADEKDGRKDFLTRFITLHQNHPELPPWVSTSWTFSNVIAGSDSVGTVMRTTMLNLMSYPYTMEKLRDELRAANLSRPYPQFNEVRDLPYLDACVQEGARLHPPFALPLERVVPEGGVTVLGHYLPGGTLVGGNPYVVNRHKDTFGEDAEFWRPERWLEGDDAHKRKLEQGILTFGAGRRICLGKHIGIFEIKKLIPFLLLNYDLHIVDRERFSVENAWFFLQTGVYARIEKRPDAVLP